MYEKNNCIGGWAQKEGATLYGFTTAIGIWSLLATSYVGGMMSHK